MKQRNKTLVVTSFLLFSLFFGAGNLIFPPYLGQSAGDQTFLAMVGFLIPSVVLPVLGIVVVARFDGLDRLSQQVGRRFGQIFTLLIFLSIGPGLGIPRAASVPFEMAFAPYLPEGSDSRIFLALYSLVFFLVALWLCRNPGKILESIGGFLTPALLILLLAMFVGFLFRGEVNIQPPQGSYATAPFRTGFTEGYTTMDAIAALNFGLVATGSFQACGLKGKKEVLRYTTLAGIFAGFLLAVVYILLAYMGMCSSGVYALPENGAQTLRVLVYQIFGTPGAILLAAIFTLACLTTCVGLINSISQYFSTCFPVLSYNRWVSLITLFSFLVCNLGLTTILSVSMPILNAIYPAAIVLILLGLSHRLWEGHPLVYPLVVGATAVVSVICALDLPLLSPLLSQILPLYDAGYGWLPMAVAALPVSLALEHLPQKRWRQ